MIINTDFHIHTELSCDVYPECTLDAMIQRAIDLGMTEIAITDHLDNNPNDEGTGLYDWNQGYQATLDARKRFGDKIVIRHGIELSEPHLYPAELKPVYDIDFDIIIGSIHYVGPYGIHSDLFDNIESTDAIAGYFGEMLDMVKAADIDVLGHLDYFERYRYERRMPRYNPVDFESQIRNILSTIIERGITLEINTSGYRSSLQQTLPHPRVIRWYYDMGGRRLSLGSDAHKPDQIGMMFDETTIFLKSIGFTEYHIFRSRQIVPMPLDG